MNSSATQQDLVDYAFCHGLLMADVQQQPQVLPLSVAPSAYPNAAFQQAWQVATDFNQLMVAVANNHDFLGEVQQQLAGADSFSQQLFDIYQQAYADQQTQQAALGIFRSDYLLHQQQLRQVEINTIACAFPAMASLTTQMHQHFHPQLAKQIPENTALREVSFALANAWYFYADYHHSICFVVQTGERNRCDQKHLQHSLEQQNIPVLRLSLAEIAEQTALRQGQLYHHPSKTILSVIYFRAGYVPDDYQQPEAWTARLRIEQSQAIKCPAIHYQLAGLKKVQQLLSKPAILSQFVTAEQQSRLQACFATFYDLDDVAVRDHAIHHANDYVLKPQREGGGHNLYGQQLSHALQTMSAQQRQAWILMQRIQTPTTQNCFLQAGKLSNDLAIISELGIYSHCFAQQKQLLCDQTIGYLLRSKAADNDEGGVAAGFAVLDSPVLF